MPDRRQAIAALAPAVFTRRPLAQQSSVRRRIAVLSNFGSNDRQWLMSCFLRGLDDVGLREARDLDILYRSSEGISARFPGLAAELIGLRPDVILVVSTPGAQAVQAATHQIPAVFVGVSDPVTNGIVASLARPGGNMTGISNFLPATTGKLLELLKSAAPSVSRPCVLFNPSNPGKAIEAEELRSAAVSMTVALQLSEVRTAVDIDKALETVRRSRCDALIVLQEGVTFGARGRIVDFAKRSGLPSVFQIREFVESGGLMSYGLNYCNHFKRGAAYVGKVLKGESPENIAVEMPTSFELVINMSTARQLGLRIDSTLRLRADALIEP